MPTPQDHPIPVTMQDWMRGHEKRVMHQERRPQIKKASDLLGPGFAPTATHILDWNSEEARFNGFFWSSDEADNVPDEVGPWAWLGLTISTGHHGQQITWSHGGTEYTTYHRHFHVHSNQMPVFGEWVPLGSKRVGQVTTGTHVVGTVLTTPVTFSTPYPVGVVPRIALSVANSSNPQQYNVGHADATHLGFNLKTHRNTNTTALAVDYIAMLDT
jgi:hypothetical protein